MAENASEPQAGAAETSAAAENSRPAAPAGEGKVKPAVWLLLIVGVVVVFGLAGFVMGGRLRKPAPPEKPKTAEETAAAAAAAAEPAAGSEAEYYEIEPFTVTLDTPRRDRFLAVTVILAIRSTDQKAVAKLLDKNKREVRSKLTLYLNSRTLDDVTGDKNLNRILREMQDLVNEFLWPGQRPMVTGVLLKNLAIQ
jgi:flagellar basal body-associated protein FliL